MREACIIITWLFSIIFFLTKKTAAKLHFSDDLDNQLVGRNPRGENVEDYENNAKLRAVSARKYLAKEERDLNARDKIRETGR